MFSEYASKFLSQSGYRQPPESNDSHSRSPNQRRVNPARGPSRLAFPRPSPYQPTASTLQGSGFNLPFGSRYAAAPDAPLFHSAAEFREEDSYEEYHADLATLQQSRRAFGTKTFGANQIGEESESESGSEGNGSGHQEREDNAEERGRGRGIKSSWRGRGKRVDPASGAIPEVVGEEEAEETRPGLPKDTAPRPRDWWKSRPVPATSEVGSSKGNGDMDDVKLASTVAEGETVYYSEARTSTAADEREGTERAAFINFTNAPEVQRFNAPEVQRFRANPPILDSQTRRIADIEASAALARLPTETLPQVVGGAPPMHDVFYGTLYLLSMASMISTFFLVMMHTETPSGKLPDTIYSTLHSSFYMLACDTVGAVILAAIWLAMLRSFAKPLVYLLLVAVPVILFSFAILPFTASFKGTSRTRYQDTALRWVSFIPLLLSFIWCYVVYKGRHSLTKAVGILEFSTRILIANGALVPLAAVHLAAVISFTWLWLIMFTRVFLGGHFAKAGSIFIIDSVTWWLGAFFVMMYLWTVAVFSGIHRATTGATVSQWYFHRGSYPVVPSNETVNSAFFHSTTTLFGTICMSTFLALLIRLPLLILPKGISKYFTFIAYNFVPSMVMALVNPLALTYAAIHSQPLQASAHAIAGMQFLSNSIPTSTITPRTFSARNHTPLVAYRLAKLILRSTRVIMAVALGFGGWVAMATQLSIGKEAGLKGSAYAYVVGMIAAFIGWNILGAMEGVVSGIIDSALVCYGSENNGLAQSGGYCLEAAHLFGEDRGRGNAY